MKKLLIIGDQAICSLSNFLLYVILAKRLSTHDVGQLVLITAAIMLLNGVQNSLLTSPMRIYGVNSGPAYWHAQFRLQLLLSFVLSAGFGLVLYIGFIDDSMLAATAALALFGAQLHEFFRIVKLAELRGLSLTSGDTLNHGVRLLVLWFMPMHLLTPSSCLLVLGVCALIWPSLSLLPYLSRLSAPLKPVWMQNWLFGRWVLIETITYNLSTRGYLYLVALLLSLEATAGFQMAQNLVNTSSVLVMGVLAFCVPLARGRLLQQGYHAWLHTFWRVGGGLVLVVAALLFLISLFPGALLELFYNASYAGYAELIPLLALAYFLSSINSVLAAAFRTVERPQIGVVAKTISGIVSLLLAYPLMHNYGARGAALGILLSQLIWLVVYLRYAFNGGLSKARVESLVPMAANNAGV